jgi:triacylglycerol esterase/lipase EstA (alpha/beta hydrolase family)
MRHDTMSQFVPRTAALTSPRTARRPARVESRTVSVVHSLLVALAILALGVAVTVANAATRTSGDGAAQLPIVFVHGQSGSAQQFETQAMRFTSNGYPQSLLYAFEYDTSSPLNPLADLDVFIDAVRAATGAERVYAVGHSRGTTMPRSTVRRRSRST